MKNVLITSAIATLLAFTHVAHASPDSHKHNSKYAEITKAQKAKHMQARLDRMATKLSLTDEQKTEIQELKQTGKNDLKPLFIEKRGLEKEIRELDISTSDYAEKLADAANRYAELTRQLTIAKGTQRQKIESILTEEQLALKNEMRNKRKRSHGKSAQK